MKKYIKTKKWIGIRLATNLIYRLDNGEKQSGSYYQRGWNERLKKYL